MISVGSVWNTVFLGNGPVSRMQEKRAEHTHKKVVAAKKKRARRADRRAKHNFQASATNYTYNMDRALSVYLNAMGSLKKLLKGMKND